MFSFCSVCLFLSTGSISFPEIDKNLLKSNGKRKPIQLAFSLQVVH